MQASSNVFLEIIKNHWIEFKVKYPSYDTEYYNGVIAKVINCGNADLGFMKYQCLCCGLDEKIIGFSCKTLFCLRCSRLAAADFVTEVQSKLHSGVVYRHLILTIPEQLRVIFYNHRFEPELYNLFFRAAWACIQDVIQTVRRKSNLKCGCLMVLHTVGRKGDHKPHLHILLMDGAIDEESGRWVKFGKFPYEVMRKKWQYHLLTMIKEFSPQPQTIKLVDRLWREYQKGFVFNILEGKVPQKMRKLTNYIAKYLFRPSISLKRIKHYDKDKRTVSYEYSSHETHKMETETVGVLEFIGRMVQQILPSGFQRVRYYGLQATASFKKSEELINKAMETQSFEDTTRELNVFVADNCKQKTFSDKVYALTGQNPLKCKNCGGIMELVQIWVKGKGYVFDLLAFMESQATGPPKEASIPKKSNLPLINDQKKVSTQMDLLTLLDTIAS